MHTTHFVSGDWGTSHLRLRVVETSTLRVLARVRTEEGAARVSASVSGAADRPAAFAAVLTPHLAALDGEIPAAQGAPVIISGMVGSSVGWQEVPYATVPFALDGSTASLAHAGTCSGHPVWLIGGVRSATEVMRGEECELLGLLADPACAGCGQAGWVVLPGTHAKHAELRGDHLVGFRTFMTGELFGLLADHGLLARSIDRLGLQAGVRDDPDFAAGVTLAMREPLSSAIFRVRTRGLLDGSTAASNARFLSGLLIGAELQALRAVAGCDPILLAAGPALRESYATAAAQLGWDATGLSLASPEAMELAVPRGQRGLLARL